MYQDIDNVHDLIAELEGGMRIAAENLDFERAIDLRDEIDQLKVKLNTSAA